MKRLAYAALALLALSGAAWSADLPPAPYYKAPAYLPPVYNWTGFYIGANGGGGFGYSKWDTTSSFNPTGGVAGGTLGYNYQFGAVVLGVEGDIDWAGLSGSTTGGCPAGCKTSDSWLSTVRGRLGYAADRFMPYITGGGAFGNIQASTPGLGRRKHHQCRLDRRRGPRIRRRTALDAEGGIPLRRPRQIQLRRRLRCANRQRHVHDQSDPRRV